MCKSAAEGGQRCHGHAAATLVAVEAKCNALAHTASQAVAAGQMLPFGVYIKGIKAGYQLADARARYASTPQGEADLAARMGRLEVHGHAPTPHGSPDAETYNNYAQAITEGHHLRGRSKMAHDMVKAGTMTGKEAEALTQYPSGYTVQCRANVIAEAKAKSVVPLPEDEYELEAASYSDDIRQMCRMEGDKAGHKHWRTQLAQASAYYREHGELDMVDDVSMAVRESYARHRVLIGR